jgi:hypothetical protein
MATKFKMAPETYIFLIEVSRAKLRKRERSFEKPHFLNFWHKQSDFGSSLAKNFTSE